MKILTPLQRAILKQFPQVTDADSFYLTGGTALAYFYLKHRQSHDLDFFTSLQELVESFSQWRDGIAKKL